MCSSKGRSNPAPTVVASVAAGRLGDALQKSCGASAIPTLRHVAFKDYLLPGCPGPGMTLQTLMDFAVGSVVENKALTLHFEESIFGCVHLFETILCGQGGDGTAASARKACEAGRTANRRRTGFFGRIVQRLAELPLPRSYLRRLRFRSFWIKQWEAGKELTELAWVPGDEDDDVG